jgi:hypothetical protein
MILALGSLYFIDAGRPKQYEGFMLIATGSRERWDCQTGVHERRALSTVLLYVLRKGRTL